MRKTTLRLKPFGKTFVLSLIVFTSLLGGGEAIVRIDQFQAFLTPPNMGTRHYEFGYKLAQLDAASEREGRFECMILGNSNVDLGIDPQALAKAYRAQTGQDIRCFNFAIDGLPAAGAGALAHILVEDYQPGLLIYGTDARDYAVPREAEATTVILDTAWIAYRLGDFSTEGWLLQPSYLCRYRTHFPRLLRFDFKDTLSSTLSKRAASSRITKRIYESGQ